MNFYYNYSLYSLFAVTVHQLINSFLANVDKLLCIGNWNGNVSWTLDSPNRIHVWFLVGGLIFLELSPVYRLIPRCEL